MTTLPAGWTEVALGDVCEIRIGKTPPRADSSSWEGGDLPWLSIADMDQGRDLRHTKEKITTSAVERYNCRLVEPGTLLLSFKLSIGKLGFARIPLFTNEAIAHLPVTTEALLPEYLYRALQAAPLSRGSDRAVLGKTLNKSKLAGIRFPLPPLDEQRRIAAILDKADELRANRRSALEQLDALTQAIFLDMFGDPVSNHSGWERHSLGSLLQSIDSGKSPVCAKEPALPGEWGVLKLGAVTTGRFDPSENKRLPTDSHAEARHEVRAGDVLFSRKNTAQLVGACAYVPDTPPRRLLSDLIFRLRIADNSRMTARYLVAALQSPRMRRSVQALATGAAASMPNISKQKLMSVEIPVPEHQLQVRFEKACDAVELTRRRVERGVDEAESLAASLRSRAFRGEL